MENSGEPMALRPHTHRKIVSRAGKGPRGSGASDPGRVRGNDIRIRCTERERAELWARYAASGMATWADFLLLCTRDRAPIVVDGRLLARLSGAVAGFAGLIAALDDVRAAIEGASDACERVRTGEMDDIAASMRLVVAAASTAVARVLDEAPRYLADAREGIAECRQWMGVVSSALVGHAAPMEQVEHIDKRETVD